MNLDEAQIARVRQWIDQGLKVAEVQSRLAEEFGVSLTYMEARFLLDDLKLKPKDLPKPPAPAGNVLPSGTPPAPSPGTSVVPPGQKSGLPNALPPNGPRVAVTVDQITRPGALVSGGVTFRDGQSAEWQMDQMGRLAVVPKKQGYKPSAPDVEDFQVELQSVLTRLGY